MDEQITLFGRLSELSYENTVPMHTPGHKRNAEGIDFLQNLGAKYDITEISGFDNLQDPTGILKESMERAANLWRSERSFFLVNGSTVGVLSAVRAAARASGSGKIIMARNCHRSVYNAAQLCDLEPIYIAPPTVKDFGFCGSISPKSIEQAVTESPGTPVILTSPTYEGITSNLAEIAVICHLHGSPLIVDEAHGAHLDLSPHFQGGAVRAGADIVIQSLHKTLTGLTQTAILHSGGSLISSEEIQGEISIFQTTSPSYPLLASIDGTVNLIEKHGSELFGAWKKRLDRFDDRLDQLQSLKLPGHSELFRCQSGQQSAGYLRMGLGGNAVYGFDRSKILISCEGTSTTGVALLGALRRRFDIECEMAAGGYLVAMSGILSKNEHLERLVDAVCTIDGETRRTAPRLPMRQGKLPPRHMSASAALQKPCRTMSLRDTKGKIAAEYVWAYPPGIPLVVPGEELTDSLIRSFTLQREAGVALKSTSGEMPRSIRVVK